MPKQKKNAIKYCDGCLSSSLSRSLKPIEEYYDVYMLLMNKKFHKTGQGTYPLMCWECLATLRNFVKYQNRFRLANDYLVKYISKAKRKVMYLSDLIETYNDTWFEMEHEEKESLVLYQVIPLTLNNTQESAAETIINIESDEDMGITICEPADPEMGCTQDVIEIESEGIECKTEIAEIGSEEMAEIGNDKIESSEEILKIRTEEIGNDKMQSNEGIREQDAKVNIGKTISKIPADNKNYYTKKINDEERMKLLDEKKSLSNYKNRVFKCETCVQRFTADGYEKHIKKFHSKSADYECHYCRRRMKSKRSLTSHIRRHYRKYVCLSCDYSCLSVCDMKRHAIIHARASRCLKCGRDFGNYKEINDHYYSCRSRVRCDYCDKSIASKDKLIQHIRRLHLDSKRFVCDKKFSSYDVLKKHNKMADTRTNPELSCCVECDLQYQNVYSVTCPVCKKVYHRTWAMNDHYKLVHLRKTNYYCGSCSRTNRILSNQLRSHTGEKPCNCQICSSEFTQKYSLKVHKQSVHKIP